MKGIDTSKLTFSNKRISTEESLKDVEPFIDFNSRAIVIDKNNSSCLETIKDEKYMKRLKKMKEMAVIFNKQNIR